MNSSRLCFALLAPLTALLGSAAAQDPLPPPPPEMHRQIIIHHEHRPEMKPVAFLGVGTSTVFAALSDQLGLPADTGLLVMEVAPGSPADGVLKSNDVITKLDDQILIEPRQFAVLVRSHHKGDEVTLTYVRGGKTGTATVKLGEHEGPSLSLMHSEHPGRAEMDHTMRMLHGPGGGPLSGSGHLVIKEDKLNIDINVTDGKKVLVAKDGNGHEIFNGPIDTPEQRKGLPPEIARELERVEHMHYQGDEMAPEVHRQNFVRPPQPPARPAPEV